MSELLSLLRALPTAGRLYATARKAARGDPTALAYLKDGGWAEALDLVRPGAGETGRLLLERLGTAGRDLRDVLSGNVVDAEYSVVEGERKPPWSHFTRWLRRRRWGAFVILGPKGQGKTTLAVRLAQVWRQATGWRVEGLNVYREDSAPWLLPITAGILQRRMDSLAEALGHPPDEDEEEEEPEQRYELSDDELQDLFEEQQRQRRRRRKNAPLSLDSFRRRILLIDEASLFMGTSGVDAGRRLARQAMAQARHLDWLVIYIGQLARMMPLDMLLAEAVFVKQPSGYEPQTDRQDVLVQDLWKRTAEGFSAIRQTTWWGEFPDPRSWAYVDCPSLGGQSGAGYRGMVPFRMASDEDESAAEPEAEAE